LDLERLMRLTIEAIDPSRARVLARRTVDGYVVGTVPGIGMALYHERAGLSQVHLLRVSIRRY
jgi:hypothetical protein